MVRLGITAGLEVTEDGLTVSWNCNLAGDLGPHFEVTWIWEPTGTGYYPLRAFLDGVVLVWKSPGADASRDSQILCHTAWSSSPNYGEVDVTVHYFKKGKHRCSGKTEDRMHEGVHALPSRTAKSPPSLVSKTHPWYCRSFHSSPPQSIVEPGP
jgi:hypothetical protein